MGPRAVHAAKAQWALARAAGAATWAIVGGSDEAAAEHASEAVTRLSEADVLCTCFATKTALLHGVEAEVQKAMQRRLLQLAEALNSAADTAEARAEEMAAAQNARECGPCAPRQHKLKMPGDMLYLGAAAHRDGDGKGDLVPHGDGRLFFADGSCIADLGPGGSNRSSEPARTRFWAKTGRHSCISLIRFFIRRGACVGYY
jgi:hypothetical protein